MYGQDFLIIFFISLPNIFMKNNALNNLEAAQLLINNSCYTESVHCSYYAVLQYMKYMLNTIPTNNLCYEEQTEDGMSSHEKVLSEIKNRISNYKEKRAFQDKFRDLKNECVRADYKLDAFDAEESAGVKQKAEGLITNLKTYFGNI